MPYACKNVYRFMFDNSGSIYKWVIRSMMLMSAFALMTTSASAKHQVLVLHSYHENLPWSQGLMRGIYEVFDKSDLKVDFYIEYMDHIRHFRNNVFPDLESYYRSKFTKIAIDVIIATDDVALDFLLENRRNLFPDVPIVFCGPNNFNTSRIEGHRKITGVAEKPNFKATIELILKLHPNTPLIALVQDGEPAGRRRLEHINNIKPLFADRVKFSLMPDDSLEVLKNSLLALPENSVVFFLAFLRDRQGREYSTVVEVLEILSKSCPLPFYTYKKIDIGHGAVGGVVISEELMAEKAAQMALRILNGEDPDNIPPILDTPTIAMFDYVKHKQFNIDERTLPREHVIYNKPFSFYETYKQLVWWISSVIVVLALFIVVLLLNIAKRKKMERLLKQSENKFRGIVENATEGIFQTSQNGEILSANPALARILDFESPEDLIRQTTDIGSQFYRHPEHRDDIRTQINEKGYVKNFETQFVRRNGDIIDVSINAHAVHDDKRQFLYFEGILEDITQRKKSEKLQIARECAEASARSKSRFLADMSHEIRTPLNAILGLSDLALKTDLTDSQQSYLNKIKMSGKTLLSLINNILDFSKIEAGKMELESVDFKISDVMQNLNSLFSEEVARKHLELSIAIEQDVPVWLRGDPLRVGQVLTNLTSNAVKFTSRGEIKIQAGLIERNTHCASLILSVQDSGIGISEQDRAGLFNVFSQAEGATTRKYGGSGLGLAICKEIVQKMGGEIWVESTPGKGSTFQFSIRLGIPSDQQQKQAEASTKSQNIDNLEGARILLAEDNPLNQQVAMEILQSEGIHVDIVNNGLEAIAAVSKKAYDLLLMDVQMPEVDGFEATRRIRGLPDGGDLPIIAMTAHAFSGYREKCIDAGMNDYISKPFYVEQLVAVLSKWIPDRLISTDTDGETAEAREEKNLRKSEKTELNELPGIDVQAALKRLVGNRALLNKLLIEFSQKHGNTAEQITRELENGNREKARSHAHTIKGVAGNLSANDLFQSALVLEEAIASGETDLDEELKNFDRALKTIVACADSLG